MEISKKLKTCLHASAIILLTCLSIHHAQSASLTGTVQDSLQNGMDAATVNLFRLPDSAFVKTEITDVDGNFEFVELQPGRYYVIVTYIGYAAHFSDPVNVESAQANYSFPNIRLSGEGVQLEGISVVAARPFVERRSDRLIVNVDNSILASGSSAMEVLERAPGVVVSSSDAISIRGRSGVIIMIDGKITPMTGQELANYLRSMPSSDIDRIEIITNPSAKYDAAGNAGILDIRLKKEAGHGTNGSATAHYNQGKYPKYGGGLSLNHRQKNINVFGSYNYAYREGFNDLRLYRAFFEEGQRTGAYDQKNYFTIPFNFHSGRFGIDYSISKNTIAGVIATGNYNYFTREGRNTSRVEDGNRQHIYTFGTDQTSDEQSGSFAVNGNIKHTFPKGKQELSMDLDYARYQNALDQDFLTRYTAVSGEPYLPDYYITGDLNGDLDIRSLKMDFMWPVSKTLRLEAGIKGSIVGADNELVFFDESDPLHPVYDTTISNHFIYEEKINAAYVNMSQQWEAFSLQAGLRVEQTIADGIQLVNSQSFDRDYTNLFPSIFLNYTFSDNYAMGINMSRRLDRPSYQQLNPFKYFLDPSTYREGNPFLNPQFTWSFEWNHTLFQRFTASVSYARTNDIITQVIGPVEGQDRITVQTDRNLASADYYSFNANIPINITKKWNSNNNFSCYIGKYRGTFANTNLNQGNMVFDWRTTNSYSLGNNWTAEVNFSYHSREVYAFMDLEPMWGLGAGIQKSMFQNRGTLRLAFTDIFWQNLPAAFIKYRDYEEHFDVYRETRQAMLSYTHRFGDNKLAPARRRSGGAEEEKQRAGGGSMG